MASGVFVGAYFDKEETLWGYQNVLHQIIDGYGLPKCMLGDNRTVFEYLSKGSKEEAKNTLIQLKYSCISLGIKLQTTSVATYKALIERGNGTFGRRLPQELRINNIDDLGPSANAFLASFLDGMNKKFARPYKGKNAFRKAPDPTIVNNLIGTITRRVFDKGACIRYNKAFYFATIAGKIVAFAEKTRCLVIKTFDGRIIISVDSVAYRAVAVGDCDFSESKQCNPDGESFISSHRVDSAELANYRKRYLTSWSYCSFERYVKSELDFIEQKN